MVLILDGNSERVAHAKKSPFGEKKNPICHQMSEADQTSEITPYVCTYFEIL